MELTALAGAFCKLIVLPPASLLLLYVGGALVAHRLPRLSRLARHGAVALLYLLSTGVGAWLLTHPLEMLEPTLALPVAPAAGAIVVLTAGRVLHSPEYGGRPVPDFVALERITYAAYLVRATGLPLLVSGGLASNRPDELPLASSMQQVFEEQFRLPVRWVETASRNTVENARFSAVILRQQGIRRIILVTDAVHMRRARIAFEAEGMAVNPAPTFYVEPDAFDPSRLMPTVENLRRSHAALYEWFGLTWYWLTERR